MTKLIRELFAYGIVSAIALAVDIGILWVLVALGGMHSIAAATLSFLSGAVVAYMLSVKLVFHQHRLRDRRAEFITFVAIGLVGLLVNDLVIAAATTYASLNYLVAKGIAALFTFTTNFFMRRQILFVKTAPA